MSKSLTEIGHEFVAHSGLSVQDRCRGLERAMVEFLEAYRAAIEVDCGCSSDSCGAYVQECADVVLTLAAMLAAQGYDLQTAVEKKHSINMQRTWAPHPTIPGSVQHVKEPGE